MLFLMILLPLAGTVAQRLLGEKESRATARNILCESVAACVFVCAAVMFALVIKDGPRDYELPNFCMMGLTFRADGFRAIYVLIAAFMWLVNCVFSQEYMRRYRNKGRYWFYTLITLSGTLGLFLANDLFTAFVFFEIASMAGYPWVAQDETEEALSAAGTYIAVSIICGMITLMGMFMIYDKTGSLSFDELRAGQSDLLLPAVLTLVGFAAKAGVFPLHIWLPKAHPVAPAPASALLSGVLTKTGVFGVIVIAMNMFLGSEKIGAVMLVFALVTMLVGAVLALFSNNLKRTLACSSMSQIGYILCGISAAVILGEEGAAAAGGAVMHMVNHSLFKLGLFGCAGVVYMNLHKLDLNDIRGFGRGKKCLQAMFIIGALGISGVPLLSGYVSKTLIHEGIVEVIHHTHGASFGYKVGEWVFLLAAGLTTGYMLKLYTALFVQKNADESAQKRFDSMNGRYISTKSLIALASPCVLIVLFGILPGITQFQLAEMSMDFLRMGHMHMVNVFNAEALLMGGLTLVIGTAVYFTVCRRWMFDKERGYINRWPQKLDLEKLVYRPLIIGVMGGALKAVCTFLDASVTLLAGFLGTICAAFLRMINEISDQFTVLLKDMVFTTPEDRRFAARSGIFARLACAIADGGHRLLVRLAPSRILPHRSVTDMRYGSYITNAISFGLILCTIGVLAAIIYIFIRAGI